LASYAGAAAFSRKWLQQSVGQKTLKKVDKHHFRMIHPHFVS
jgi:hypothetical protein